jgi:hypothetical protein
MLKMFLGLFLAAVLSVSGFARAGSSFSSSRSSSSYQSRSSYTPSSSYSPSSSYQSRSSYTPSSSYAPSVAPSSMNRPSSYTPKSTYSPSSSYQSRSSYTPSSSYASTPNTTINHNYGSGGYGGGSPFLSSMAGSFVGMSLFNSFSGNHGGGYGGGYAPAPVYAGGAPMVDSSGHAIQGAPVVLQQSSGSLLGTIVGFILSIIVIGVFVYLIYRLFKYFFKSEDNYRPRSRY